PPARGQPSGPAPAASPEALPRRRILLVDDDVDAARSLALLLEFLGQDVQQAHDGISGLEIAETYRPDLVLLDLGLPQMDGYEVASRLRQRPQLSHTVVVAMTGYGSDADRRRSLEAGCHHHLTKPVDLRTIQDVLASLPTNLVSR